MIFRKMSPEDNREVFRRALEAEKHNTSYLYKMLPLFHPDCCWVAEDESVIVGFVVGFKTASGDAFVWQIFVTEAYQRRGVAVSMLSKLVQAADPIHLIATVEPDNVASQAIFKKLARMYEGSYSSALAFTSEDWEEDYWGDEDLVTVSFAHSRISR